MTQRGATLVLVRMMMLASVVGTIGSLVLADGNQTLRGLLTLVPASIALVLAAIIAYRLLKGRAY